MTRFEFPLRWQMLLSLALMVWVASFSHEFTHHLTGAVVCSEVGRMSLNRFVVADPCAHWPLATAAGPTLSYLMMWLGAWLLRSGRKPLFGFALVVAYIPFLRLLTAAMGGGDEGVLMRMALPGYGRSPALMLVLALTAVPLSTCWRALAQQRRGRIFAAAFLLPIIPVLAIPKLDAGWYSAWLAGEAWVPNVFGVPVTVWAVHALVAFACVLALGLLPGGAWRSQAKVSPPATI